jgi:hypothetical protein
MEIWKTIPGYSLYQASNMGRIKTFNWKNLGREAIMKPAMDGSGYLRTMLKRDGDGKIHTIKVHRIILTTFKGNPPTQKHQCNHINCIRTDNRDFNLEWVTNSENQLHSFAMGMNNKKGSKNPAATLTEDQVIEIRKNYIYGLKGRHNGVTKQQIADKYNTSFAVIKQIVQRRTWKHLL